MEQENSKKEIRKALHGVPPQILPTVDVALTRDGSAQWAVMIGLFVTLLGSSFVLKR